MDGSSSSRGPASFATQANALLRKNIAFQKRNLKSTIRLVCYPIFLCILLTVLQKIIDQQLDKPKNRCGCRCVDTNGDGVCENVCGIQYSTLDQVFTCAIPNPPEFPPFLQVPRPEYRAARTGSQPSVDLPEESCRKAGNCPATVLLTGGNRTLAEGVAQGFFSSSLNANASSLFSTQSTTRTSNLLSALSSFALGTDANTRLVNFIEPAILSDRPVYALQKQQCMSNSKISVPLPILDDIPPINIDVECVQGAVSWRNSSATVNDELYKGYRQSNTDKSINEIMTAFDFLDSDKNKFNLNVWYNSTYKNDSNWGNPVAFVRAPRLLNLASNAYLKHLQGPDIGIQFEFTKEMPKPANKLQLDFSSLLGPLFFKWVIELLFPVLLTYLVYEKQHKLRIMMKMHGLGDGPYWIISYGYFLVISSVYVLFLVVFGSLIGLKFFTANDYSIQFVFYIAYINLQIALAFLMATGLSNVKIGQAITYMYIFGSGLLAAYLFRAFIEDLTFSRNWVRVMEIIPAFALYRGMYEFGTYAFNGEYLGTSGMRWKDLTNGSNGMKEVLIIIIVEWLLLLPVAYYIDQLSSFGVRKNPLNILACFREKKTLSFMKSSLERQGSKVVVEVDKPDIIQEREVVEQLLLEPNSTHAIICHNLKKVYPGRDGNPDKLAVQGLSLAVPRGECLGVLGPNGAGKTTFIHTMIGLVAPTSGNAYVQGFSIQTDMDKIYSSMGVCPQHDMLWEMLTGREHLLFYGRLKNLKGQALTKAVEESLKSVNLFHGGVADKQAGKYSGGMKRRLSVSISLIGDPKVVYMDEPSTGLDPASRNNLWEVIKKEKQNRAIILTTHSMEEAEVLCDRVGIFVGGGLQCIGNPKQLKGRYGGTYVFTMTTSPDEEQEVENLARQLTPNANKIYHISGTQKFEIPKQDVKIAAVFQAVELAKRRFPVQAWGLADTTLEDVFIKVAKGTDSLGNYHERWVP